MMKDKSIKPIDKNTIIFARPNGYAYHIDRNCKMLQGSQFEHYGYVQIKIGDIKKRDLFPCPACAIFRRGE